LRALRYLVRIKSLVILGASFVNFVFIIFYHKGFKGHHKVALSFNHEFFTKNFSSQRNLIDVKASLNFL